MLAEVKDARRQHRIGAADRHPVDQMVERISRALAFASVRNRIGMVVPLVGSVVGGIVNSSFQNDVGKAARFAFQARRLRAEEGVIEG